MLKFREDLNKPEVLKRNIIKSSRLMDGQIYTACYSLIGFNSKSIDGNKKTFLWWRNLTKRFRNETPEDIRNFMAHSFIESKVEFALGESYFSGPNTIDKKRHPREVGLYIEKEDFPIFVSKFGGEILTNDASREYIFKGVGHSWSSEVREPTRFRELVEKFTPLYFEEEVLEQ